MKKTHRIAAATLFVIALPGGSAVAVDDGTDVASALVLPSLVEREQGVRGSVADSPLAPAVAPSTCSETSWTAKQPINANFLEYAVVSEYGGAVAANSVEARLSSGVITPLTSGAIDKLKWWGISNEWDPDASGSIPEKFLNKYCGKDDNENRTFRITFYTNDGGLPGQPLAIRTNTPADFLTDVDWDPRSGTEFQHYIAEYTANFGNPVNATQVAWISIRREAGPKINGNNECVFLWINESDAAKYDDAWVQDGVKYDSGEEAFDLTYCLEKGPAAGSYTDIYHGDFERGDLRYWTFDNSP